MRFVNNWSQCNTSTNNFLLAASLLTNGENYKALQLFEGAAKGIFTEQFLAERMLTHETSQTRAYISYYLKIIHLFELHKAYDCAIKLADTALNATSSNDPLVVCILYIFEFLTIKLLNFV